MKHISTWTDFLVLYNAGPVVLLYPLLWLALLGSSVMFPYGEAFSVVGRVCVGKCAHKGCSLQSRVTCVFIESGAYASTDYYKTLNISGHDFSQHLKA